MKKYLYIILVPFLMTIGLTGCYTEVLTSDEYVPSDNSNNPIIIYYPVPVADPAPVWPHPAYPHPTHPQPVYSPITQPTSPGNKGDSKRSEPTIRNDNGERGNAPGNIPSPQRPTRIEPTNNSGSTSRNSNGNSVEPANSGNSSASRNGNTSNNSPRNNDGGR